jgi:hypothetical protein
LIFCENIMVNFKEQLRRQILFIENSCRIYDQGHAEEAIRIAVALRVLFHDTPNSKSILHHLGSKSIFLLSTADLAKHSSEYNLALVQPLVKVTDSLTEQTMSCIMTPPLDDPRRRELVLFQTWWRKELIVQLENNENMNRRDLILAAANKDGGAHVDEELHPTYDKLRLGAGMEIAITLKRLSTKLSASFENVHYASLRQMAYEVLNSPSIQQLSAP